MMNIGIRLHDTAGATLREHLLSARAQGFRCGHAALSKTVPGFSMKEAPSLLTDNFTASVKRDFDETGISCAVLGCYLTLGTPDEEEYAWMRQTYLAHLAAAPKIGALVVGTETPTVSGADIHSEELLALVIRRLKELCRAAEEQGALLAIEPVYRHVVCTPERAERVLDAVGSESLRIILDSVNLLSTQTHTQADALIEESLRRFGDRVSVLHMKDYRPYTDRMDDVEALPCGTGLMDYSHLLRFAKERDGLPMTLENTTPDTAVAAREYLERVASAL